MHEFAALIALVDDHLFPHSGQISLWCLIVSARAVLTVGPRMRPQEHEAEYMMYGALMPVSPTRAGCGHGCP